MEERFIFQVGGDSSMPIVISSESENSDEEVEPPIDSSFTFTPTKRTIDSDSEVEDLDVEERSLRVDNRLKLEDGSAALPGPSCKKKLKFETEYFKGVKSCLYTQRVSSGYAVGDVVNILLNSNMDERQVCTVQPLSVSENATFVVDVDMVHFQDLKADDLSVWLPTGTKKSFFRFTSSGSLKIAQKATAELRSESCYYTLTHRYYVHKTYDKFHRQLVDIKDANGGHNRYVLVQYWFNRPEIEIKVKPHGNSTSSQPYFRTASSAQTQNKMIAARNTPNTAMHKAVQQQGGELMARGLNKLPRNSQQIRNYRRSETKKDTDALYSVMLQCKLSEGKSDSFVRDVKAAPDPQCVLYTDWQMSELVKFTTKQAEFCVFVADTTYNLGDFYVTPTTYQHLMLEDSTSHKHPSFLGPTLVHQRKNFSFNYFSSTLIGANNKLQNVQAFGTDGDLALIEAFSHNFRDARQLRCFIHLKRNISDKLRERGIPSNESSGFIADIFGNCGSSYEEGLVDAEDAEDFEGRLSNCEEVWLARESKYLWKGQVSFYCYFKVHYASIVRSCMLKDLQTSVGLGSPPAIFTTNCSESINAMIKRKVDYKATEWPQFNDALKEIVEGQREEAIRSLSGRGRYRVCKGYKYLQVDPQKWATMSPEQRQDVIKQFDSAPVRPSRATTHSESTPETSSESGSTSSSRGKLLWVDPEETGITSVPLATLKEIWAKAAEYASSTGDVVPAPGNHPKAKMVSSRSNVAPHFVCAQSSGQYTCDSTYLQWKFSQICSHSVAVAAINGDLEAFVKWYVGTHQLPNFTTLATHGLPAGRGRKGGIPRRPRSRKSSSSKRDISVARPAVAYRDAGSHLTGGVSVSSQPQSHTNASGSHLTGGVSVSSQPQSHTNASDPHLTEGVSVSSQPQSHTNASGPHLTGGVSVSSQPQSHSTTGSEFTPLSQQTPSFTIVNSQSATSLLGITCATPQTQTINIHPKPAPMPTSNPFFVKFIQGNIRVCQGCRGSLKNFDNSLPKPPFDLAVARFERRPYRDRTGEWRIQHKSKQPTTICG